MLGLFSAVKGFVPKGKKVFIKSVFGMIPTDIFLAEWGPGDGGPGGGAPLQDHDSAPHGLLHPRDGPRLDRQREQHHLRHGGR